MSTLRLPSALYEGVAADIRRPHPFAYERVGFLLTRRMSSALGSILVAHSWHSVPDDGYLEATDVGARISRRTIRDVLRRCLEEDVGAFHVHFHEHHGPPGPSEPDERTFQELTPALVGAAPRQGHGAVIFSLDAAHARTLTPEGGEPVTVVVVGQPLRIWRTS